MFTPEQKSKIAEEIQRILRETGNSELPDGEISFLLHVDGRPMDSWANIRNTENRSLPVPEVLIRNMSMVYQAVKTYLGKG